MINEIVIIRIISAVLFFLAFVISFRIYSKSEKRTDIWLLISAAVLLACAESVANSLEWAEIFPGMVDTFGEYLIIAFSLSWIYITHRFVSEFRKRKS